MPIIKKLSWEGFCSVFIALVATMTTLGIGIYYYGINEIKNGEALLYSIIFLFVGCSLFFADIASALWAEMTHQPKGNDT